MSGSVRVRVPATSANLGPGFDSLGLALGLHDEIELTELDGGRSVVEVHGEGVGRVPRDERHLVLKAACATYELAGVDRPPLHLTCHNAIPHSRGLGSSASAAVAGIVAACALLGPGKAPDDEAVLDLAARFDGHADNVAACLYGGLVVTWCSAGSFRAAHLEPHPDVVPVAFVSAHSSSTEATRGLLPDRVPHGDAAFTASRAALVVHALTRAPDLLLPATEDRLHQPYRRPAYPATAELVDALRSAGVPATVSGAGPTVLALTTGEPLPEGLPTSGFETVRLPIDTAGAVVTG
ncbi:homoserine kinase [Actinomycetospora corticicola]|uniref:Homoserine kinase n=1 Tax=Actinomycetospora corticicola TaxID=663602 RepID=A0A7Y9DWM4_9PSEU|nr:homoserine kinase [Actinomycetospora corticicola]